MLVVSCDMLSYLRSTYIGFSWLAANQVHNLVTQLVCSSDAGTESSHGSKRISLFLTKQFDSYFTQKKKVEFVIKKLLRIQDLDSDNLQP